MPENLARTGAGGDPVVYAGRFVDRVAGSADLLGGWIVLGEQDTLPHKLAGALNRVSVLVFLDLHSFPFEAMDREYWDVPMVVVLPSGFDAESLSAAFGTALFERLGFFDRIVAPDSVLWEELRRKYRWSESQRVQVASNDPSEVITALQASLESGSTSPARHNVPRVDKTLHRAQAAVLEPRFAASRERCDAGAQLDVLEVGVGAGRWVSIFDPSATRFVGIDVREDSIEIARANFPDQRFDLLGPDLLFPYGDQSFDLVFSVISMHRHPAPAKHTLLSQMWRVARPGGRLLFLEDFVSIGQPEGSTIYPTSTTEFIDLILEATVGQVTLEHVESLRYPGEDLHRGGLISLLRLGVSKG